MKKIILLLCLFIFQTNTIASSADKDPNKIILSLKIEVSLRIPHNTILITLKKVNGGYVLQTDTNTLECKTKDKFRELHTSKMVDEKWLEQVSQLEKKLNWKYLKKKGNDIGLDGTTWELLYRNEKSENYVSIWCPEDKKHEFEDFLNLCNFILDSADFDSETLLPKSK